MNSTSSNVHHAQDYHCDMINPIQSFGPLHVFELPKSLHKEINLWVKESRLIKNHPLAELRAHENFGYLEGDNEKHNSYQCSIPPQLIENSFFLPYVIRICSKLTGVYHRDLMIRKWDGHFDGYDVWTNFAYKGDDNPEHKHFGLMSGVIYVKNDGHPTIFPELNYAYVGKNYTMILFPSQLFHLVEEKKTKSERVTIAFNIIQRPDCESVTF